MARLVSYTMRLIREPHATGTYVHPSCAPSPTAVVGGSPWCDGCALGDRRDGGAGARPAAAILSANITVWTGDPRGRASWPRATSAPHLAVTFFRLGEPAPMRPATPCRGRGGRRSPRRSSHRPTTARTSSVSSTRCARRVASTPSSAAMRGSLDRRRGWRSASTTDGPSSRASPSAWRSPRCDVVCAGRRRPPAAAGAGAVHYHPWRLPISWRTELAPPAR